MEESRDDFNMIIRRNLCEFFGSFEDFNERLSKNLKHGVARSKMKNRSSPFVPLQMSNNSPSYSVPVQVALHSMKNLVDEPISALPNELSGLKFPTPSAQKTTPSKDSESKSGSSSSSKRRFEGENTEKESKRKKMPTSERNRDEDDLPFSPDSGVHSTENELTDESAAVETMLSIMTSLEGPRISPIPSNFVDIEREKELERKREKEKEKQREREKRKEREREKQKEEAKFRIREEKVERSGKSTPRDSGAGSGAGSGSRRDPESVEKRPEKKEKATIPQVTLRYPEGSTTSSASTSREVSPEVPRKRITPPLPAVTGHLKLDNLKAERLKKLIKLADNRGKLIRDDDRKVIEVEKDRKDQTNGRTSSRTSVRTEQSDSTPRKQAREGRESRGSREKGEKSEKEKEKPSSRSETPSQKPLNKTVHHLAAEVRQSPLTASPRSISSSMTTPTLHSRPNSSLSSHDPTTSSQSINKPVRWSCQWEKAKAHAVQRVPIPDPLAPNQKSKGEFYHELAKDWKSKADKSKDRVLRPLNYMLSSVFFVLEAIWKTDKERTVQARMQCASIYRDTCELLGVAVFQGVKDSDDALAVHLLPRIKILGQIMLSVMQYQMYLLRSEQVLRNFYRLESPEVQNLIETHTTNGTTAPDSSSAQGWAASLANCQQTTSMPTPVQQMYRNQLKIMQNLALASRYWEDSKALSKQVDERFVKHIETICGRSIGMDTSFEVLAQFVLTAVGSLKNEYEEEQKLPVRPVLAKMKPVLEIAVKIGSFHSSAAGDRSHRTSQSTPRLPTATSTPQKTPNPPAI